MLHTPAPVTTPAAPRGSHLVWLLGPGPRGGSRLPRPGQRRQQHDGGRRVRLPPGVDRRARQRHGVAHPIPLRQARHRHRQEPARAARRTHRQHLGPPALLGCRPSSWPWPPTSPRSSEARSPSTLLFDLPLLLGGVDHRHRLDAPAHPCRASGRQKTFELVIISMLVIIAVGFVGRSRHRSARCRQPSSAGSCPASRAPRRCCSRHPFWAPRSCRTPSTRTPPSPATVSARADEPRDRDSRAPAHGHPLGRVDRPGHRGDREPRHPAARAATSLQGVEGTDTLEGAHAAIGQAMGR